jgi:hypothetical protein
VVEGRLEDRLGPPRATSARVDSIAARSPRSKLTT